MISRLGDDFVYNHIPPALLSYYVYFIHYEFCFLQNIYLITILTEHKSFFPIVYLFDFLVLQTNANVLK